MFSLNVYIDVVNCLLYKDHLLKLLVYIQVLLKLKPVSTVRHVWTIRVYTRGMDIKWELKVKKLRWMNKWIIKKHVQLNNKFNSHLTWNSSLGDIGERRVPYALRHYIYHYQKKDDWWKTKTWKGTKRLPIPFPRSASLLNIIYVK